MLAASVRPSGEKLSMSSRSFTNATDRTVASVRGSSSSTRPFHDAAKSRPSGENAVLPTTGFPADVVMSRNPTRAPDGRSNALSVRCSPLTTSVRLSGLIDIPIAYCPMEIFAPVATARPSPSYSSTSPA